MSREQQLTISIHDEVPRVPGSMISAGLEASNQQAASLGDVRPLSCFSRLSDDAIIAGVVGRTWGSCGEMQQLWIDPAHRREGVGTRLMREFEAHAEGRGCPTFHLDTFSFQAPALY